MQADNEREKEKQFVDESLVATGTPIANGRLGRVWSAWAVEDSLAAGAGKGRRSTAGCTAAKWIAADWRDPREVSARSSGAESVGVFAGKSAAVAGGRPTAR